MNSGILSCFNAKPASRITGCTLEDANIYPLPVGAGFVSSAATA
jgi:hypothetical protein